MLPCRKENCRLFSFSVSSRYFMKANRLHFILDVGRRLLEKKWSLSLKYCMEILRQSSELSWFFFVACTGNEKQEQDQEELQRLNTKRTNNTNKTWRKMSPVSYEDGDGTKRKKKIGRSVSWAMMKFTLRRTSLEKKHLCNPDCFGICSPGFILQCTLQLNWWERRSVNTED